MDSGEGRGGRQERRDHSAGQKAEEAGEECRGRWAWEILKEA